MLDLYLDLGLYKNDVYVRATSAGDVRRSAPAAEPLRTRDAPTV